MLIQLLTALAATVLALPSADRSSKKQTSIPTLDENTWQTLQHVLTGGSLASLPKHSSESVEPLSFHIWDKIHSDALDAGSRVESAVNHHAFESWDDINVGPIQIKEPDDNDVAAFPGHGPMKPIDLTKYTIGQILNWTLCHPSEPHALPLHKLAHLVNYSSPVAELLSDSSADLTLFAPDDNALTPPWKRGKHHSMDFALDEWGEAQDIFNTAEMLTHPVWEAFDAVEAKASVETVDDDSDDKETRRKQTLLHILEMVLKYHVSPGAKSLGKVVDASTLGTMVPISSGKDVPFFRIRVGEPSLILNRVYLNFYSPLLAHPPVLAKNGIIHLLGSFPLVPPLSPLSKLFLYPEPFSTLTTAVQKVGMDDGMLPHCGNKTLPILGVQGGDDEVDESVAAMLEGIAKDESKKFSKNSFTIFAPTNKAFRELGPTLNAILFSPFGSRLLRHILSYHVVPDLIFHTDHIDNLTSSSAEGYVIGREIGKDLAEYEKPECKMEEDDTVDGQWEGDGPHLPISRHTGQPPRGPTTSGQVNVTHYLLPTLLGSRANESLAVDVAQYRVRFGHGPLVRRIVVNHSPYGCPEALAPPRSKPIAALLADGVAWGGAVHVIPTLIRPPFLHHVHGKHTYSGVVARLWT